MGNRTAAETAARAAYRVYPLDPLPNTEWDLIACIALGLAGLAVQLGITAKGKK
jgi:hypothetical protein